MVILVNSKDYSFVNVELNGQVDHFNPRLSDGDHQHLVWVIESLTVKWFYRL